MEFPFSIPIKGIDYTPEYDAFIRDLDIFHRSRGVLGGIKLDLYKLKQLVRANGGVEAITQERGWKKIATYFDLALTCTNAATYMQALWDYDLSNGDPSKTPSVPEGLQKQVMIHRIMAQVSDNETLKTRLRKETSWMMNSTNKAKVDDDSTSSEDEKQSPEIALKPTALYGEGRNLGRLMLAVYSQLFNEFEFALPQLLSISAQPDVFLLDHLPRFTESVLFYFSSILKIYLKCLPIENIENFEISVKNTLATDNNVTLPQSYAFYLSRRDFDLKILLLFRNLSLNRNNAKIMSKSNELKSILESISQLPLNVLYFHEWHKLCIDIIDNICYHSDIWRSNAIFNYISSLFYFSDLYFVSSSCQILSKILIDPANASFVEKISPGYVKRSLDLLLCGDLRLVRSNLDFLYQFVDASLRIQSDLKVAHHFFINQILTFIKQRVQMFNDPVIIKFILYRIHKPSKTILRDG
ncbi:hypothetical protein O9G_003964 [Rozella allomycis CSF55]|uniref:ARID domain-containing protein n=1 Tax=Rozella allomycis (strain CSF55) TaxID=988480 RepID=A0A075B3H6_ROZAC|nr:hypothetical protein O9G_003964 [Rozella allomycis CSF55]|eukprot:EPZ35531.1 hypothetical protein O9G_003964 [Rozella allomycis CSF55]